MSASVTIRGIGGHDRWNRQTVLIPVQVRQARMAKTFADSSEIPEAYWRLSSIWYLFGTLATLLPLVNIYWMVFKPAG